MEQEIMARVQRVLTPFISSWRNNFWIAMDEDGMICLYNTEPGKSLHAWVIPAPEIDSCYPLELLEIEALDWENCLVSLNGFRQSIQSVSVENLNIPNRMDCWL